MSKPQLKPCGHCRGSGYTSPTGLVPFHNRNGGPAKLVCNRCGGKGKVPIKK